MTDKEKLLKLRKLADAMYYAAQHLTTDASRLHKAMDEYHKFIIHECKEEPVSEDLEEAAISFARKDSEGISNPANFYYTVADKARIFKAGAKWQKEQMMRGAIDTTMVYNVCSQLELNLTFSEYIYKSGEKVKVLIIKEG